MNVEGSQAARLCDGVLYMHAGPEIGVASTKAFSVALMDLLLLGMHLGQARGTVSDEDLQLLMQAVLSLPGLVGRLLAQSEATATYAELTERFYSCSSLLYLGRGLNYPIAREGALKLKEISYLHAEGYPAGEMKHGPIALVSADYPVVVIAPRDNVYAKMMVQIEQIKARNGVVLAVGDENDEDLARKVDYVLPIPQAHALVTPNPGGHSAPVVCVPHGIALRG